MEIANTSHDAEIDALRIPWETTDQWNLRREFLKRNWNKMPIERLRGRAQAFINMQFMGCSYEESLMQEIRQMGAGITDSYNDERKKTTNLVFNGDSTSKHGRNGVRSVPALDELILVHFEHSTDLHPKSFLIRCLQPCHAVVIFDFTEPVNIDEPYCCSCGVNGTVTSTATGDTKNDAARKAAFAAIESLSKKYFVLQAKVSIDPSAPIINLDTMYKDAKSATQEKEKEAPQPPQMDKASKMLAKFGWKEGQGLGKNEQGISAPITVQQVFQRRGFGSDEKTAPRTMGVFRQSVSQILADYAKSDDNDDLVFSSELTNDQRKCVHEMARRFTGVLKTVSVGKNENRQLTIRKVQSVAQLVRNVLLESGGENNKYRVYLPGKWPMLKYFPDPSVVTVEEARITPQDNRRAKIQTATTTADKKKRKRIQRTPNVA